MNNKEEVVEATRYLNQVTEKKSIRKRFSPSMLQIFIIKHVFDAETNEIQPIN